MESLSRPFHSRKLSNAASFSNKTPYDAVFTAGHKYAGASPIDVQDYREIFGSSQASSIPVLDLSTFGQKSDALSFNFRDSKPDYSKIFGGFRDEDVAVSYEELFGRDKARTPASTAPASQVSDNLSYRSPDGLKQFNMSYNKIHQKSKDGLDGTKHVTQLPAVTGFTCFVDEPVMEAEKPNQLAVNVSVDSPPKRISRKERNHVESISVEDKKSKIFGNEFKKHPSKVSSSTTNVVTPKDDPRRSVSLESRKTDLDEEIDVNSSASAALKKAIEKAQESIRIAKESVGRKKSGLRSFSNKKFKNSLKVEEQKCTDEDSSQVFLDVGRNRKYGGTVLPNFMESEKLFVVKKFIDEIHEKISESVKDSKFIDDTVAYNAKEATSETDSKPLDSAGKAENATLFSEAVDTETSKIQIPDFVHEYQTDKKIIDEYEAEIKVSKPTIDILEHQTVMKELESEENDNEVSQDFNQNDIENRLDASLEILQNEKQENVLEHEEIKYEESEKQENDLENKEVKYAESEKQENVFEHEEVKYAESEKQENVLEYEEVKYAESEKHEEIEEASKLVESENESEHDQNSEIHKDEETSELFDGFDEINAKDSVQICDNKSEESEVNLHDDCETKQEVDHTVESKGESLDESCDQKFDEKSSGDVNVIAETVDTDCVHVAINNVEVHDVNFETTQDVDDVPEVSCEFQAEETDLGEKTTIDQTVSDDNEDAYEVKSEASDITDNLADLGSENDVRFESSSGSTHGEKIIDEESNIQPPHKEIPDIESTNEIKDSQEPESRHKEDEVEGPGPSKVSGKDRFVRIDEEAAAKQREWEKNRLAVDRAIREARERAFAEARERAERERAAVEKATEEVRQRMMAEAHEKVSKASVTNKSSSEKTSAQSKLRAERAAVERATSEARQRALEKALSQKTASDLNRSESALRTKAKLEKHNRIMERASKALAEKEKRDRLAQKEQAERNRLAVNLDADIKRWANGKEGNLRALLSTLQYILGPESGWQAVALTEIITTSAVKKAYRKATLCVHPDKLQQRGATIQHKYICEKVFDLLKAAWNRFNSEER